MGALTGRGGDPGSRLDLRKRLLSTWSSPRHDVRLRCRFPHANGRVMLKSALKKVPGARQLAEQVRYSGLSAPAKAVLRERLVLEWVGGE